MKITAIRELSVEEAVLKVKELKSEYLNLIVRKKVKPIAGNRLQSIRRTVARLLTVIKEKNN